MIAVCWCDACGSNMEDDEIDDDERDSVPLQLFAVERNRGMSVVPGDRASASLRALAVVDFVVHTRWC